MDRLVLVSYVGLVGLEALATQVLVPIQLHLLLSSFFTLYIGCHRSLKMVFAKEDSDHETMTHKDAKQAPLYGGAFLLGLYVLFKLAPRYLVDLLLQSYFAVIGVATLTGTFDPLVRLLLFAGKRVAEYPVKISVPLRAEPLVDDKITSSQIVTAVGAVGVTAAYFYTKHFLLNNLFGIAICVQGLEQISVGTYVTGATLLAGLFVYDIVFVFGSDVMVTVAKGFDAPIKLLFPKTFASPEAAAQFSMLGLGDIVVPGLFIALLLRFDAVRAGARSFGEEFSKPYFNAVMMAYVLGLVATVVVMVVFDAAQPALLYLVPACLLSSWCTALWRGEFGALCRYSEEESSEEEEKEGEGKGEKEKEGKKDE